MKELKDLSNPKPLYHNQNYFLITKSIWKRLWQQLQLNKFLIPGYNYFSMLQSFINRYFEVDKKYLEYFTIPLFRYLWAMAESNIHWSEMSEDTYANDWLFSWWLSLRFSIKNAIKNEWEGTCDVGFSGVHCAVGVGGGEGKITKTPLILLMSAIFFFFARNQYLT